MCCCYQDYVFNIFKTSFDNAYFAEKHRKFYERRLYLEESYAALQFAAEKSSNAPHSHLFSENIL